MTGNPSAPRRRESDSPVLTRVEMSSSLRGEVGVFWSGEHLQLREWAGRRESGKELLVEDEKRLEFDFAALEPKHRARPLRWIHIRHAAQRPEHEIAVWRFPPPGGRPARARTHASAQSEERQALRNAPATEE